MGRMGRRRGLLALQTSSDDDRVCTTVPRQGRLQGLKTHTLSTVSYTAIVILILRYRDLQQNTGQHLYYRRVSIHCLRATHRRRRILRLEIHLSYPSRRSPVV